MGTVLSVVVSAVVGLPLLFVLLAFLRLRAGRKEELKEQHRLGIRTKHQLQQHRQRLREAILANPYALIPAFQLAKMIRNRETTSKRAHSLHTLLSFLSFPRPSLDLVSCNSDEELMVTNAQNATKHAEVVEEFIKHVETVNPTLNAVVAKRFEEAREEARIADDRIQEAIENGTLDTLPPLLGGLFFSHLS